MGDQRDSRSRSRTPDYPQRTRSDSRGRSRSRSDAGANGAHGARGYDRQAEGPRSAKIVIEKLTKNVNEGHLREIFSQYGEIEELEVPLNKQFLTNRGIAYVLYATPEDAENAIAHMHEAQLDGALINVSIVLPRRRFSRSPPPRRPPPNRFGEAHRYREQPSDRGNSGGHGGYGGYGGGRGGRGGRPHDRGYQRSRSPPMRGGRGYERNDRSRSPQRRRSPPGGARRRTPDYDAVDDGRDRR